LDPPLAEPLKNSFGPDVPERIIDMVSEAFPEVYRGHFLALALNGYEELELTPRARHISDALAAVLPAERELAIRLVTASLGPEIGSAELTGMESFLYLPFVFFVADHGLECYETSMRAQYELTKRFTAEFSIRAYLERYPEKTLKRLAEWARDPNVHVRRLVSEGARPRLPWASRLRAFQKDSYISLDYGGGSLKIYRKKAPVIKSLKDVEILHPKLHPETVVKVAERWWVDASSERKRLVRHALRTLIKEGNPGALAVLGYWADSPIEIRTVRCEPEVVRIGEKLRIVISLHNRSQEASAALLDLRIHFVKANGSTSPKVFKGSEVTLDAFGSATVKKTISLAQHSTRKHYPGPHLMEVMLNGVTHPGAKFEVL